MNALIDKLGMFTFEDYATSRESVIAEGLTKLNAANISLKRSNADLDDFAYIASHDLKEPLRAINNHSCFLLEDYADKLDEDGVKRLNRLIYLTARMEKLIADLLYFSRLGREVLGFNSTDLNNVIDDLKKTFEATFVEQRIEVRVPESLPTIKCDTARTTELFRNLIANAIKYNDSDEKRIEIGFKNSQGAKKDGYVFFVKDNGIGIEESHHKDVFRIFKRLNSKKRYGEGTGSGLTFVKKIVEQHGGKIWLESEEGRGSVFYFTLQRESP